MSGQERIEVGGRGFLPVGDSTVAHDLHFMALIKASTISDVTQAEDESPESFAARLMDTIIASGHTLELLGSLIVPESEVDDSMQSPGEAWTKSLAGETADFLGSMRTPKDKAIVRSLILTLLVDFFERGIVSLWTTGTSSRAAVPGATETSPNGGEDGQE